MHKRAKNGKGYWPGLTKDIQETRDRCKKYCRNVPLQMITGVVYPRTPSQPMEMITGNMASLPSGKKILILTDRYSEYMWAYDMANGGTGHKIV